MQYKTAKLLPSIVITLIGWLAISACSSDLAINSMPDHPHVHPWGFPLKNLLLLSPDSDS